MDSRKRRREEEDNSGEESRQLKKWMPWILDREYMERLIVMLVTIIRRLLQDKLAEVLPQPALRLQNDTEPDTRYQLKFLDDIPAEIYTHREVFTEDGRPIRIAIVDTNKIRSGRNNDTSNPLSSSSVEIVVLHGDVDKTNHENWAENDVACERKGKEPLLKGEQVVKLQNGVASLNIRFTDNSKSARNQRFRIGLKHKLTQNAHPRVQSTISKPLRVLERRGLIKRNIPPRLDDEVWHLDKIRRDGDFHNRLINAGIVTVRQFLQQLAIDTEKLRKIIGNGRLTNQAFTNETWKSIVQSARKCDPGNEVYSYYVGGDQGIVLFFNSIYKLLRVNTNGRIINNPDEFDEQALVRSWKEKAFANTSEFELMVETPPPIFQANVASVQTTHLIDQTGDKVAPCSTSRENLTRAQHSNHIDHQQMSETGISGHVLQTESNFNDAATGMHSPKHSIRNVIDDSALYEPSNSLPQPNLTSLPSSSSFDLDDILRNSPEFFRSDEATGEMVLACVEQVVQANFQQYSSYQETHTSSPFTISLSTTVASDPSSSHWFPHNEPENNSSPMHLDQLHFSSDDDIDHIMLRCPSFSEQGRSSPAIMEFLSGDGNSEMEKIRSKLRGTVSSVIFSIRIRMEA